MVHGKVQIFWAGHKNLAHLPLFFWQYLIASNYKRPSHNIWTLLRTVSTYTHKLKGFFLLLRAAVFRRAPKQHSIEKVVAAKLHFTDNNLAASIYLDARTNTHTKKIPTWKTTNRKPRIGLLFTLYAYRKKSPMQDTLC